MAFMDDFGKRLEADGELVDAQALSPEGAFVRADEQGRQPVTDGPFAETKDLIAGWYVVDVDGWDRAVELATRRVQREVDAGRAGASSSVVKVASAKTNQARHELVVEMLGLDGLGWSGDGFAESDLAETRKWLRSMGNSIEGGTSEINLNVLAKQVLGLPTG